MAKNKKKYGVGGSLGTAIGGLAGTFLLPGIGTAAGMAIGNALGSGAEELIRGNDDRTTRMPMLPASQITYADGTNTTQTLNPYGNTIGYAFGGPLQNVNQPQITNYQGPSHEQGGIPIGPNDEVEGNEVRVGNFIFSDRLKPPNSKLSFADIAKKIQKKYKDYKNDSMEKRAMIRELAQLAKLQEGIKEKLGLNQQDEQGNQDEQGEQGNPQDEQMQQQGMNPQMMQQAQQQVMQQQGIPQQIQGVPQQHAYGGFYRKRREEVHQRTRNYEERRKKLAYGGPDDPPTYINDFFSPLQKYKEMASAMNQYFPMTYKNDDWLHRQFIAPTFYSSYSGKPYSAINFRIAIPIGGRKGKNGKKYKTVRPQAGIYPSYIYTPRNAPRGFEGQYIPNLIGAGKNNVGKILWGKDKKYTNSELNDVLLNNVNQGIQNTQQYIPVYGVGGLKNYKIDSFFKTPKNYKKKDNTVEYKYGGIYIKPENRGKFTEYCGGKVTNECIQRGLSSPNPIIRRRANFARNARKWHQDGGVVNIDQPLKPTNFPGWTVVEGYSLPEGLNAQELNNYQQEWANLINDNGDEFLRYMTEKTGYDIPKLKVLLTDKKWGPVHQAAWDYLVNVDNPQRKKIDYSVSNLEPNIHSIPVNGNGNNGNILNNKDRNIFNINLPHINTNGLEGNLSDIAKYGLTSLGGLYDIYRGLKGGQYESYGRIDPLQLRKLDPSEAIQEVRDQSQFARTKIGNVGGQGLGQYLNNMQTVTSNAQRQIAGVQNKYDTSNVDIMNKERQGNANIQAQNINLDMKQNDINARERDEASNTLQRGLTTLGQAFQQGFQDQAMREAQDATIKMIGQRNFEYIKDPNNPKNYVLAGKELGVDGSIYYIINGKVYSSDGKYKGTRDELISKKFFKI